MQVRISLLVFCVSSFLSAIAQTGLKPVQSNIRPNRGAFSSNQFNGYDYPVPANGLRLPQNNFQQQPTYNHNTGYASQSNVNHNSGFGAQTTASTKHTSIGSELKTSTQPLKPIQHLKPVQTFKNLPTLKQIQKESHPTESHTENRVQTIKVIHENRSHGSSGGNVKTVRIIHDGNGYGGSNNHGNVQTVKIIREGSDSGRSYSSGYGDSNVKTVRIVQGDHSLGESSGRSAERTIRIIQERAPSVQSHGVEESNAYQILESPSAESYVSGNNVEEEQTLQSFHELSPETLHSDSALKIVSDGNSGGYSTSHNVGGDAVTLRVLDNSGAAGYQNAYTTGGNYKTYKILQDSSPVQYASQQFETVKLVEPQSVPQTHDYKTVRLLQDSQYGGSPYSSFGGINGILKVLQTAGINTGYGGHGDVKLLSAFKK